MNSTGSQARILETLFSKISSSNEWFIEANRRLDLLTSLSDNWNGYGAPKPNLISITNARSLINCLQDKRTIPRRILPSAEGGVEVNFRLDSKKVAFEFYNDGSAIIELKHLDSYDVYEVNLTPKLLEEKLKFVCQWLINN